MLKYQVVGDALSSSNRQIHLVSTPAGTRAHFE